MGEFEVVIKLKSKLYWRLNSKSRVRTFKPINPVAPVRRILEPDVLMNGKPAVRFDNRDPSAKSSCTLMRAPNGS